MKEIKAAGDAQGAKLAKLKADVVRLIRELAKSTAKISHLNCLLEELESTS